MTYDKSTIVFEPISTHPLFLNLAGQVFGRLTVLGYAGRKNNAFWFCECVCSKITKVSQYELSSGRSRSCGCLRTEITVARNTTHGEGRRGEQSPEYIAYSHAKARCNDVNHPDYHCYGGRGIKFCFESFEQFLKEVGRKPTPKYSLDRKNTNGHYEPGNVRWATSTTQNRNRRDNRQITYKSQTQCLAAWSESTGFHALTISKRLRRDWCVECALTLPLFESCLHKNTKIKRPE